MHVFRFLKFFEPYLKNGKFLYKKITVSGSVWANWKIWWHCPHMKPGGAGPPLTGLVSEFPVKMPWLLAPSLIHSRLPGHSRHFPGALLASQWWLYLTSLFYLPHNSWLIFIWKQSLPHWFHHLITLIFTLRRFYLPFRNVYLRQRDIINEFLRSQSKPTS